MPESKKSGRRLTRCRTGCMRCRVRRRKCDEGKPRCQNCIDRNFQCQYGAQLSFLTKNAHTIQASEVEASSGQYSAIQFVNEKPQRESPQAEPPITKQSSPANDSQEPEQPNLELTVLSAPKEAQDPSSGLLTWSPIEDRVARGFSDNDESAVAGLLALGSGMNEMSAPDFNVTNFTVSPSTREPLLAPVMTPFNLPDNSGRLSPSLIHIQSHSTLDLSSTERLELLRHYRYNVASWLDICDLGQLFGIQGLQLAMVSQDVYDSLLDLSDVSMHRPHSTGKTSGDPRMRRVEVDMTINGFLCAIDATMDFALDVSKSWSSRKILDNELLQALSPHTGVRGFNSAIYWLLVRLDLGAALATDSNLQIPIPPSPPYIADADIGLDPYSFVFCYAYRPLWICGQAVEFAHNEDSIPRYPPLQTWMQLVEDLENWYDERPQGFQAMLELELEDQEETGPSFPIVLFANGAGVFSNQLYHTAMLILLHNRPRTARVAKFSSTTMSPLWHAQRICSIALNNERHECWDPCLLASFLTAARRMTHEAQQQEILQAFDRIKIVTGWDLGDLLHGLKEDWGFLDT